MTRKTYRPRPACAIAHTPPRRYPHVHRTAILNIPPTPQLRIPLARSPRQSALAGIVHPGDGDVARAIRAMQRKHFDPPELQPRVKRPRGFIMVAVSMGRQSSRAQTKRTAAGRR